MELALALLGTLQLVGKIWIHKLGTGWADEVEKTKHDLWLESNKEIKYPDDPDVHLGQDQGRIIDLLQKTKELDEKFKAFANKKLLEGTAK